MSRILPLLCVLPILGVLGSGKDHLPRLASVTWSKKGGYQLVENEFGSYQLNGLKVAAWGNFTNAINKTGWSYLEIATNPNLSDKVQAYAAGYLEGQLTRDVIQAYYLNTVDGYCDKKRQVCKRVKDFLRKNLHWSSHQARRMQALSPYWHQVALFFKQFKGLVGGYNAKANDNDDSSPMEIRPIGFWWMNVFGDLEDLEPALATQMGLNASSLPGRVLGSGSCSALVKVLPGNKDIYFAHDTWNSYQSMVRILKKYDLPFHRTSKQSAIVPGRTQTMSSYPGTIYSGDDFNTLSSGLAVVETTIGNSNADLWQFVRPVGQLLEGIRVTVANRLATNGAQWTKLFAKHNSGTYNNQWMVLDYKLFRPGQPLKKNLFWVLEQLPGHVHREDVTDVLEKQTYWASYNTPYFKDIFKLCGNPAMVEKYGDWFSYDKTPRALIFKRDHGHVKDLESMTKLMRYNNFKEDPLSRCNCTPPYSAENAISSRSDLNPKSGHYPFAALGHRSHGGTDMKLTGADLFVKQQFVAWGGPTYDQVPAFQWSKADFEKDTPHFGQPDLWRFQPVTHQWGSRQFEEK